MFFSNREKSGMMRHSEFALQVIIANCLKGGNVEMLARATSALGAKKRMAIAGALYTSVVLLVCKVWLSRILL